MMRPLCLLAVAMLAVPTSAFIPQTTLRSSSPVVSSSSSRTASRRTALTMMAARRPFIAGNWKENPDTLEAALDLAKAVAAASATAANVDVAVVVPFPFLVPVKDVLKGSKVFLGAQDLYTEDKGAYTGATSLPMIKSVGAQWVLCGHSERRALFGDTDETVNAKLHKVLSAGLKAILCIGETKDEYELGVNKLICGLQLAKGLKGVTKEQMANVAIAYEPVWAIGTGLTATPEIAQDVHFNIRKILSEAYGKDVSDKVIIQYGGSVTPDTVDELMAMPDIDGALVGGASLVGEKFARIINHK